MISFDELVGTKDRAWCDTLAYWLGTLAKHAPASGLVAHRLREVMTRQYDMEEQSLDVDRVAIDDFTGSFFAPIAPVTLTRAWCPLDSMERWLGQFRWFEVESSDDAFARGATAVLDYYRSSFSR
jgi:hypothetical protein